MKGFMRRAWLLAAVLVAFTACNGDDNTGCVPGSCSCNMQSMNLCWDFTGAAWSGMTPMAQAMCAGGTFSGTTACPTVNRVGSCLTAGDTAAYTLRYYTGAPFNYDDTSAGTHCDDYDSNAETPPGTYTSG